MKKLCVALLCLALLTHGALAVLAEDVAVEATWVDGEAAEALPNDAGAELLVNDGEASIPASLQLGVKEKITLNVPGATFASSKKAVATVSAKGVVTGKKKGTTIITVLSGGVEVGRCTVKVLAAPKKVTVAPSKLTLTAGESKQLKATLPKSTASQIAWSSGDPSVAAVDAEGVVTALAPGWATITAKTFNGKKATCAVVVRSENDPTALAFPEKAVTLGVKEKRQAFPLVNEGAEAAFAWSSKSAKIAAVSKDGVITGKKKGSTKVTVQTQNGLKATLTVKVLAAPSKVTLSAKKLELGMGGTAVLQAKLPKNTASQIAWISSDESVAAVDQEGRVTGVGVGRATVMAKTFNGKKAQATVVVREVDDATLRAKAAGEWKVTAAKVSGLDATTCAELITLKLQTDGTCSLQFHGNGGFPGYTTKQLWGVQDGAVVVTPDGKYESLRLLPNAAVDRLALAASDDLVYYFTQGIDPAPVEYPKYDVGPEDVNGDWVADRVSMRSLGLTFDADDLEWVARIEVEGESATITYEDGEGVKRAQSQIWYANGQATLLDCSEVMECFKYYPDRDAIRGVLPASANEFDVWFRRESALNV